MNSEDLQFFQSGVPVLKVSERPLGVQSERQHEHPIPQLRGGHGLGHENELLDRLPDRHRPEDDQHPGHRESRPHALVSKTAHRPQIVGEEHAALAGCPLEYGWILGAREPDVIEPVHVGRGKAPSEAGENPAVEVLVGCETEQRPVRLSRRVP